MITVKKRRIDKIMKSCEQYRERLINDCRLFFDCGCEQAEDCVQSAYTALYEELLKGTEIKNYRAYFYKVTMNQKNKALKDKIRRNEYDFETNEEKDEAINNARIYNPDYIEDMVSDREIEKRAVMIIASLSKDERKLYEAHYLKKKTLAEIAEESGVEPATVRKQHERLCKKIKEKIKSFENF